MSAFFVAASTQYLNNAAPPITTYPFSVGLWIKLTAASNVNRTLWCLADTGTTNNYFDARMNNAEALVIVARAGGTEGQGSAGNTLVPAQWAYGVFRFINATNRRVAVLQHSSLAHGQGVDDRSPSGIDTERIGALATSGGASQPWDGMIAEYWLTNTDIQPDGAQLNNDLLRQLAYGGPFSVPHIANDLIEYRSFRKVIESDQDEAPGDEVYWGGAGRQVWTNTNGVTRGPHPPLPGWYRKPADRRIMVPF